MKIGLDAKRAFHNSTGLGNYSRTLIEGLAMYYPEHEYYLFNPKPSQLYKPAFENVHEILPSGFLSKSFSSVWRSSWIKEDLKKRGIQLYHGLSHELPVRIQNTNVAPIVTIHDLIFERYPEQYSKIDVQIYHKKFRYSCEHSDRIIAVSKQTKQDIIEFYGIEESKISVCYQSCDSAFVTVVSEGQKAVIRKRYDLPLKYFLYVGSIIERKNLLNICKAMVLLNKKLDVPLVVIGAGRAYKQKVKEFIFKNNFSNNVIFLSGQQQFQKNNDPAVLAAIYQMAVALIYPSFFEGFGIPVLEALNSRLPVITSSTSSLPEVGGDSAYYVNPGSSEEIADAMLKIYSDHELRISMINKGVEHAQNFTLRKCTDAVMQVYQTVKNEKRF